MNQIVLFSSACIGSMGDDDFKQVGTLVPVGSKFAVKWAPTDLSTGAVPQNPSTYLSVQTDGKYETRDKIEAFETFDIIGDALVLAANLTGAFGGPQYGHVIAAKVVNV